MYSSPKEVMPAYIIIPNLMIYSAGFFEEYIGDFLFKNKVNIVYYMLQNIIKHSGICILDFIFFIRNKQDKFIILKDTPSSGLEFRSRYRNHNNMEIVYTMSL